MALLITMVVLAILTGATLALVTLATGDLELAASNRVGTLAFTASESALDEVLTDAKLALTPTEGGYAPDPGDAVLSASYPPLTTRSDTSYVASVSYLRDGPVEESSALQVRSVVYGVSVTGSYVRPGTTDALARSNLSAEVYRVAPKTVGVVSKARHFQ